MSKLVNGARSIKPKHRQYAYRVTAAGLAVVAGYGYINGHEVALLLGFASAVLGVADVNVSPGRSDESA